MATFADSEASFEGPEATFEFADVAFSCPTGPDEAFEGTAFPEATIKGAEETFFRVARLEALFKSAGVAFSCATGAETAVEDAAVSWATGAEATFEGAGEFKNRKTKRAVEHSPFLKKIAACQCVCVK